MAYWEDERRAAQDALQFGEAGVQPVGPDTAGDAYASESARPCYTGDESLPAAGNAEATTLLGSRAPYGTRPAQVARPAQAANPYVPRTPSRIQGNAVLSDAPAVPVADTHTERRAGDDRTSRLLRRAALWLVIAAAVIVGGAIALDFGASFLQDLGDKAGQAAASLVDSAASAATDAVGQAVEGALSSAANAAGNLVGDALSSVGAALS